MDVTPEAVREGRFREALRGYNRDDVDEFLDRVAGGIAVLQERLREASERAARAEAQATEATELDDSLRRTLVLAQRTADLAIEEARREAARLLEEAETRREQAMAELVAEREQLREELQKGIHDEVSALHETRARLQSDVAELSAYYERQRGWLRAVLAEQLRAVDEGAIDVGPPPAINDIDASLLDPPQVHGAPVVDDNVEEGVEESGPAAKASYEGGERAIDITDDAPAQAEVTSNGAPPPSDSPDAETASAFLSELQRAMDSTGTHDGFEEDDVLPPPDERARAFFDEEDEVAARRFGSLRRRRRRP